MEAAEWAEAKAARAQAAQAKAARAQAAQAKATQAKAAQAKAAQAPPTAASSQLDLGARTDWVVARTGSSHRAAEEEAAATQQPAKVSRPRSVTDPKPEAAQPVATPPVTRTAAVTFKSAEAGARYVAQKQMVRDSPRLQRPATPPTSNREAASSANVFETPKPQNLDKAVVYRIKQVSDYYNPPQLQVEPTVPEDSTVAYGEPNRVWGHDHEFHP